MDRMIGDLLDRLETRRDSRRGTCRGDRGSRNAAFQPGAPRRGITDENAYEVGLVPLFIKAPHQDEGVVDTIPSRTIDVLPTVGGRILGSSSPGTTMGSRCLGPSGAACLSSCKPSEGDAGRRSMISEGGVGRSDCALSSRFSETRAASFDLYSLGRLRLPDWSSARAMWSPDHRDSWRRVDEAWRLAHVAPKTGILCTGIPSRPPERDRRGWYSRGRRSEW